MTEETPEMPKTQNMTSAEVRTKFSGLSARVQHVGHHIRAWRYREAQLVMVPEDWYERACKALGETSRINLEPPPAAYKGFARKAGTDGGE
ncbi:hypothetical protein ACFYRL_17685 [Streptomyces goshikiensis]|uniref:hypothetical protein n=1 Tax=Streptomyces goshikiensis TaxID=1942 RepID=UPI0036B5F3F2